MNCMSGIAFVDSNVPIQAHEPDAGVKRERAVAKDLASAVLLCQAGARSQIERRACRRRWVRGFLSE
jgi:hypothetical protein